MTLVYPGSFDPVTIGHIDVAQRGAKISSRLIVAVLDNPNKKTMFTVDERINMLKKSLDTQIEVDFFSGLLADYVKLRKADAILRGVRCSGDYESEARYAACNYRLSDGADTVFLSANPAFAHISSSIVREIAAYSSNFISMVTPAVRDALIQKVSISEV